MESAPPRPPAPPPAPPPPPPESPFPKESLTRRYKLVWRLLLISNLALGGQSRLSPPAWDLPYVHAGANIYPFSTACRAYMEFHCLLKDSRHYIRSFAFHMLRVSSFTGLQRGSVFSPLRQKADELFDKMHTRSFSLGAVVFYGL